MITIAERRNESRSRSTIRTVIGRFGPLAAGVALIVWVLHAVQAERGMDVQSLILATRVAARWLPLIILLEVLIAAADLAATVWLLDSRRQRVRPAQWLKSSALAYVSGALLPAGRAAGEMARAAVLSPAVGAGQAVATGTRLQACSLLANTAISALVLIALAVDHAAHRGLMAAVGGNAVVCAALGGALLLILRDGRMGRWLARRFSRTTPAESHTAPQRWLFRTVLLCFAGRLVQLVQCGVLLIAVGAGASVLRAANAQGVRLVGAAVGDLIPNQLGTSEGAYLLFSPSLDLAADSARSVSIPVILHFVQLFVAGLSVVAAAMATNQRTRDAR